MSDITIYVCDEHGIFSHSMEQSKYDPIPKRSSIIAPPVLTGTQVARWNGIGWDVLPEYPQPEPQPLPVPSSVSMRQARLALLQMNLLSAVQTSLEAITDETERQAALIEWEYATSVDRNSNLVTSLSTQMGLTESQLDDLFRLAITL